MANQIKNEFSLRTGFVTMGGKDYTLVIDRPKTGLSDGQLYAAVNEIKDSDILKPDGTSLATIKSMKLVNKEETILDLEGLASA